MGSPFFSIQFSRSVVSDSLRPRIAAHQASLSITNSRSLPKLMSIESVMPSNHLILCHPLLLLPSIFPSIRVFSNESALHISWPKTFVNPWLKGQDLNSDQVIDDQPQSAGAILSALSSFPFP